MKMKWGSVSRGFWFGFAAMAILAGATAIGWNAISAYAKNNGSGSSSTWYSTSPPTVGTASARAGR